MSERDRSGQQSTWWRRHRAWVVPAVLAPVGYVVFVLLGAWLNGLGERTGNVGWSLLALVSFLAAFASPVVFGIIALRKGYRAFRRWRRAHGHLTKHEVALQQHEDAYARAWQHASALKGALMRRELPPEIPVWSVVPWAGERFFLSGGLGYTRYYGTDVVYGQSSVVAFGRPAWVAGALIGNAIGNSISRSRAQATAATQWREHQQVEVVVSNQRIACNVAGRGWLSFEFASVTAIYPDPEHFTVVLEFGGQTSPMSLTGPMAPALATLAVMLTHGHDALRAHPALAALQD